MIETVLKIDGMSCPLCERCIDRTVKYGFNVKSVKSSHISGETVILSKNKIEKLSLEKTICALGYKVTDIYERELQKRGLFSFFK